ncbi:MAG TPA: signal peptidase II [Dermatophilaceae bacterium]|nr:signal peptidase II [Dermatophilaceae bacterium]
MQAEAGTSLTPSQRAVDPEGGSESATPGRRRRILVWVLVVVAGAAYVGDRLSKQWVLDHLVEGQVRGFAGPVLRFQLTHNSGAAFSLGTGATWVFTVIASVVAVVIVVLARRVGSLGWALALGLLLGGCLGNLTDRLFRPPGFGRGEVVDFLQLSFWPTFPIFNVADSSVVSAAVLIALLALSGIGLDGARTVGRPRSAQADA